MFFVFVVIVFVLLYRRLGDLEKRVQELELLKFEDKTVSFGRGATLTSPEQQEKQSEFVARLGGIRPATVGASKVPKPDSWIILLGRWLREDFLVKLGGFFLFVAVFWFISSTDFIGPAGKTTLSFLFGTAVLAFGVKRFSLSVRQGGVFSGLGLSIILLTAYYATHGFGIFPEGVTLALSFLAVALTALIALRYSSRGLAVFSLLAAGIMPFLTYENIISYRFGSQGEISSVLLYILVMVMGVIWITWLTGWSALILLAELISLLYVSNFGAFSKAGDYTVLSFSIVYVLLFFFLNLRTSLLGGLKGRSALVHFFNVLMLVMLVMIPVVEIVPENWQSLMYLPWLLLFSVASFLVYKKTGDSKSFFFYTASAITFLGAATATELEGNVLTVALILEITLLLMVAVRLLKNNKAAYALSILYLWPVVLALDSASNWERSLRRGTEGVSLLNINSLTILLLIIALSLAGALLYSREKYMAERTKEIFFPALLSLGAGGFLLNFIWLANLTIFFPSKNTAELVSVVIFVLLGVLVYIAGMVQARKILRIIGILLILWSSVLFFSLSYISIEQKVFAAFAIGVLLVSTAFIRRAKNNE